MYLAPHLFPLSKAFRNRASDQAASPACPGRVCGEEHRDVHGICAFCIPDESAGRSWRERSLLGANPCGINTCKSVSKQKTLTLFRINTYEKQGGGGVSLLSTVLVLRFRADHQFTPLLPGSPKTQVQRTSHGLPVTHYQARPLPHLPPPLPLPPRLSRARNSFAVYPTVFKVLNSPGRPAKLTGAAREQQHTMDDS